MNTYVIFNTESAFNVAHATAKTEAGLPRVGSVNGKLAPLNQQTTEVTAFAAHPSDGTVAAEVNGGWPESLKAGLTFKTKEEVSIYYPDKES